MGSADGAVASFQEQRLIQGVVKWWPEGFVVLYGTVEALHPASLVRCMSGSSISRFLTSLPCSRCTKGSTVWTAASEHCPGRTAACALTQHNARPADTSAPSCTATGTVTYVATSPPDTGS